MVLKLEGAREAYEKALKRKLDQEADEKVEAYNNWRLAEEKKGRAQDDHGKNLVKIMYEAVKSTSSHEPVTVAMSNVIGNTDGNYLIFQ